MARFAHINIVASDWRALEAFYIAVFGCERASTERDYRGAWLDQLTSLEGAHLQGVHLRLPGVGAGGPTLEIFGYDAPFHRPAPPVHAVGFAHIAFEVENLDETLAHMETLGGGRAGDIVTVQIPGHGATKIVYARDPEGNIVELQEKRG